MSAVVASYSAIVLSVINLVWIALRGNRRGPQGFQGERGLPGDVVGFGPIPQHYEHAAEPELPYLPPNPLSYPHVTPTQQPHLPFPHDDIQLEADESADDGT